MMKFLGIVLMLGLVACCDCLGEIVSADGDCPSGEYNPGPNCSFEVICGVRSAHSARRHYCDCWCSPGLIRDSETHTCVEKCPDSE